MKKLRTLLAIALCMTVGAGIANARSLNHAEKAAETTVENYLKTKGYGPLFKEDDNSLNFMKGSTLYWITFEGDGSGIMYTLHRKPIYFVEENDSPNAAARKQERALRAVAYVTSNNDYKAKVTGPKAEFEFPQYSVTSEQYISILPHLLKKMDNAGDSFRACYKKSSTETDSIHKYWMDVDSARVFIKQPQNLKRNAQAAKQEISVTHADFRNVDVNGKEISGYDVSMRKSEMEFVQPQITVSAAKKGTYKISVKIYNVNGKVMTPSRDMYFTMTSDVDVNKANTKELKDLGYFGGKGIWADGEYKAEFYDGTRLLYQTTFSIR